MQAEALATADDCALGTNVRVVVTRAAGLAAAKAAADGVLRAIDLACSRFREDSELVWLNARAGDEMLVSPLLARALDELKFFSRELRILGVYPASSFRATFKEEKD